MQFYISFNTVSSVCVPPPLTCCWKIVQYISLIKPDAIGEDNPNGDFYTTARGRQYEYYDGAGTSTFVNTLFLPGERGWGCTQCYAWC